MYKSEDNLRYQFSKAIYLIFHFFKIFFYDTKALIDLEPSDFDRISDQQTPSFNCLCLLRTGTASHHHQAWIFKVVPKNQTQVLMLTQQAL